MRLFPPDFVDDAHDLSRWIAIPSLAIFFTAVIPVLESRLASSTSTFGRSFTGYLAISTYSTAFPGVILTICPGFKLTVREKSFSHDGILYAPRSSGAREEDVEVPNVIGPRGALTQLLMGYLSLEEIRKVTPDLSVTDDAALLLMILFPPVRKSVTVTYAW